MASYMVNGKPTKLCRIRALAHAVDREIPTIRVWDRTGIIPEAAFRRAGQRLYLLEEVSVARKIAKETGFIDDQTKIEEFSVEVTKAWKKIRANLKGASRGCITPRRAW